MELNFTTSAAIILFLITYGLIVTEKVQRTVIALCGSMAMVLLGVITQEEAIHHIDFNTLALLIGMMIQVLVLSKTGLFRYLAVSAAQKTKGNPVALLISLSVMVALCSSLLDNVTTVLLTVPISFTLARDLRISPMPFVVAQILSSNIGGTATMIGDPPNIMIASSVKELDFMAFVENLALPCVVIFVLTIGLLVMIYRRQLVCDPKVQQRIMKIKTEGLIRSKPLLRKCLFTLTVTILLFCLHGQIPGWSLESGTVAVVGASLLLLMVMPRREKMLELVLSKVEWTTIFFFIGLFVLVGGLEVNNVIRWLALQTMELTGGNHSVTTLAVLWLSALMSAFVDNIPFVATMIPLIQDMGAMGYGDLEPLWWALSLGACLGGNGTVIGASANVVALSIARKHNMVVTFWGFMKVAFPLMLLSIVISSLYLWCAFL
ncbi:MAG: ArsB/NhaD family transporter [Akkermansia sp.]|nr:ArsB/NhaD family transporter [Akkermansia sp.]MBQ7023934.1 ArsB/NhaD family transporter [Akkermansia sp.]